jgi:hypothetical protein
MAERSGSANAHAVFANTESVTLDTIDFSHSDREELQPSQHQTPRRRKIRTRPKQIISAVSVGCSNRRKVPPASPARAH